MIATTWAGAFLGLAIMVGVFCSVGLVALTVWALDREQKDRPLLPWGERMRAERARAHTTVLGEHLKQDAIEVKRPR